MPDRPTIVYDDACGFCTWCVRYARERGEFDAVGFSELDAAATARLPDDYESCAHLLTERETYSCGAAAEAILARLAGPPGVLARAFTRLPDAVRRAIREPLYRWAADHRDWWGKLRRCEPPAGSDRA